MRIKIESSNGTTPTTKITLEDGTDISGAVNGFSVQMDASEGYAKAQITAIAPKIPELIAHLRRVSSSRDNENKALIDYHLNEILSLL